MTFSVYGNNLSRFLYSGNGRLLITSPVLSCCMHSMYSCPFSKYKEPTKHALEFGWQAIPRKASF